MKNTELAYPAVFHAERSGGFSVSFPDFPEAHTQGDTEKEAFEMAVDCLHTAIEWRLEEKGDVPRPRRARTGENAIPVALDLAPKLALFQTMREQNISNVKLAEKLHVSEIVVRRMLNPKHRSKPEQYVRALTALGRAPQVSVVSLEQR
jgi:antitoxin HicB